MRATLIAFVTLGVHAGHDRWTIEPLTRGLDITHERGRERRY